MYTYSATIDRIVDGDTFDAIVDLGFRVYVKMRFRLLGIDVPERFTPDGQIASAYVRDLLPVGTSVLLTSHLNKQDKYGRYLATIDLGGLDLTQELLAKGYGRPYPAI